MRTIAVCSTKGGSGKSTTAVHLAVTAQDVGGLRVAIADCDPQGSAALWYRLRPTDTPGLRQVAVDQLADFQRQAAEAVDVLIVDSAPAHTTDVADIAALADFCIVTCRPNLFDLDGSRSAVEAVKAAGTAGSIVLTQCPPGRGVGESSIVRESREALAGAPLPVAPVVLTQRAAFAHALLSGSAVHEFEPDGKAAAEVRALWMWIQETMK